jgi:hypothetical protein
MNEAHELTRRLDAIESLVFAFAHHLAVEAPHMALPAGLRIRLQAEREADEAARRLFVSVARLLEA